MDRLAEPDPVRARRESSLSDKLNPAALLAAKLKAAKADAEEAIPAPAGKLFSLSTLANVLISAIFLTRPNNELTLSNVSAATGFPFKNK